MLKYSPHNLKQYLRQKKFGKNLKNKKYKNNSKSIERTKSKRKQEIEWKTEMTFSSWPDPMLSTTSIDTTNFSRKKGSKQLCHVLVKHR